MPHYEYECPEHGIFEEFHSILLKLENCPRCKETGKEQPIKRLISLGGKGVVELYGNELVEKCKDDAKKIQKDMHKSTNLYANMLGEERYHQLQTQIDRQKREK
jgi:putative FmdB family regulatory protein